MNSKYFSEEEFVCHCCGALPPNGISQNLINLLDDMRAAVGQPLYLNCAYRCDSHNAEVGGVPEEARPAGHDHSVFQWGLANAGAEDASFFPGLVHEC